MNDSQKILETLLKNIQKKNITEKQCLLECGINTSFFTDWKNGKLKNPAYDKIVKLSKYLNIDLNYLFLGQNTDGSEYLNNNEKLMLQLFRELTEKEQDRIIGRMENMVEQHQENDMQDVG